MKLIKYWLEYAYWVNDLTKDRLTENFHLFNQHIERKLTLHERFAYLQSKSDTSSLNSIWLLTDTDITKLHKCHLTYVRSSQFKRILWFKKILHILFFLHFGNNEMVAKIGLTYLCFMLYSVLHFAFYNYLCSMSIVIT